MAENKSLKLRMQALKQKLESLEPKPFVTRSRSPSPNPRKAAGAKADEGKADEGTADEGKAVRGKVDEGKADAGNQMKWSRSR